METEEDPSLILKVDDEPDQSQLEPAAIFESQGHLCQMFIQSEQEPKSLTCEVLCIRHVFIIRSKRHFKPRFTPNFPPATTKIHTASPCPNSPI